MGQHLLHLFTPETLVLAFVIALVTTLGLWNFALRRELGRRRRAEAALAERARQAQTLADGRQRFVAHLAHEMRNLVSGIFGTLALTDGEFRHIDPVQLARALRSEAQALLDLLDASLDAAQIDAGRFAVRPTVVDVAALLDGVAQAAPPRFGRPNRPKLELGFARGSLWVIDGVRLAQIVRNLVSNAMKYADGANVRITADVTQARLCVRVTDAGPGLSAAQCRRLFADFERVGEEPQIAGHGLGLAISCRLAQAMGGELSVSSEPGVGSVFAVNLPITPVCGQEQPAGWSVSCAADNDALSLTL